MKRILAWFKNPFVITQTLRWMSLAVFLISLFLPIGLFYTEPGIGRIGFGGWLASLTVPILWVMVNIPLAGIANFFLIFYILDWNKPFQRKRVIILGLGILMQLLVLPEFWPQTIANYGLSAGPEPGPVISYTSTYVGTGYVLWILSFVLAIIAMEMKRRWIDPFETSYYNDELVEDDALVAEEPDPPNFGDSSTLGALLLGCLFLSACSGKPSLNSSDREYIRTTVDLLKTRANFTLDEDSVHMQYSLDSVYRRHHISAAEYRTQTASLADDPKHAEAVFAAISDSISEK